MKQQKGLGRGLQAIFSNDKIEAKMNNAKSVTISATTNVQIDKIFPNPKQPRTTFAESQLEELAQSIKELGIIQPITLRNGEDKYIIISGERRWRAARMAGLKEIPAFIRDVNDEQMHLMALVENLQREDLNPIEISIGLQRLIDECSLTQEALAQRVAMKRSSVSNYLRLLKLSDEVQYALKQGLITMGHAKAIASLQDQEMQLELLKICIERNISVREAETMASAMSKATNKEEREMLESPLPQGGDLLLSRLEGIFSKGVSIKANNKGGGKIVINYSNQDELQRLIQELEIDE
ncbi:MAG: ParB/RepB/Spo0J family partition protein [Rikenellaceae bacterium]